MKTFNAWLALSTLAAGCDCGTEAASCRFVAPEDGSLFVASDDGSADPGFQFDADIATSRIADATGVQLSAETTDGAPVVVDGSLTVTGGHAAGEATLTVDEETEVVLRAAIGTVSCDVTFTVQPGSGCGIEFMDPTGGSLNADDDADDLAPGFQYTVVVSTTVDSGTIGLFVDGAKLGDQPISGPTVEFDVTLEDGEHDLRAVLEGGGDCEADLEGLVVDTVPPACVVCEPGGTPPIVLHATDDVDPGAAGTQIDFSVSTDADVGDTVTLTVDGTDDAADVQAGECSPGIPNHSAHDGITVPDGDFDVSARCADAAGNVTTAGPIPFRLLTADECPPEGTIDDLVIDPDPANRREGLATATFTAPGDCVSVDPTDPVERYELRCTRRDVVMDDAAFATATLFAMSGGAPLAPGDAEDRTITFVVGTDYHCAVKGFDGADQATSLSNVVDTGAPFESLAIPAPVAGSNFGWAITAVGDINDDGFDDVAVGSFVDQVYLFFGSDGGSGLSATPDVTITGPAGSFFGVSVSGVGEFVDSTGDAGDAGIPDLLVGAPFGDASYRGAAYVFRGRTNWAGIDSYTDADVTMNHDDDATTSDDFSYFGYTSGWAGKTDNDAFDDALIGAQGWAGDTGAAYLIHGPGAIATPVTWRVDADTPELAGDFRIVGRETRGELGSGFGALGDINPGADDRDDVAVGETSISRAQFEGVGVANTYVFRGRARPINFTELTAHSDGTGDEDWVYVAGNGSAGGLGVGASDVDEDGTLDLVLGAPLLDLGDHDEGELYVFFGDGTSFSAAPDLTFTSGAAVETSDGMGWSVASAVDLGGGTYDLDQDGFGELLFGTRQLGDIPGRGVLFYTGALADGMTAWDDADVLFDGFGTDPVRQVVYAGDVNGDGWTDMFFSDPAYGGNEGRAELRY